MKHLSLRLLLGRGTLTGTIPKGLLTEGHLYLVQVSDDTPKWTVAEYRQGVVSEATKPNVTIHPLDILGIYELPAGGLSTADPFDTHVQ